MKRMLAMAIVALFFAAQAGADGPDVTQAPKVEKKPEPKSQQKAETQPSAPAIEPLKQADVPQIVKQLAEQEITPALPSDVHPRETAKSEEMMARASELEERRVNVLFESKPENADLFVNGLYVGSTPVQMPLRDGVHNVRMYSAGFSQWERQVKVYKGLRVYGILEQTALKP